MISKNIESDTDCFYLTQKLSLFLKNYSIPIGVGDAAHLIVNELATNIIKYGISGRITVYLKNTHKRSYIEIRSVDRGPGIEDIGSAIKEHYSSSNTLGLGLSSIKRLSDELDVENMDPNGLLIKSKLYF